MPYKQEAEVTFNLEKILRDPPVLRALAMLRVPPEVIARSCGYSTMTISRWQTGKQLLNERQMELLIDFAALIIEDMDHNFASIPEGEGRQKVAIHLQAARSLVALQRAYLGEEAMSNAEMKPWIDAQATRDKGAAN